MLTGYVLSNLVLHYSVSDFSDTQFMSNKLLFYKHYPLLFALFSYGILRERGEYENQDLCK